MYGFSAGIASTIHGSDGAAVVEDGVVGVVEAEVVEADVVEADVVGVDADVVVLTASQDPIGPKNSPFGSH